MRRPTLIVSGAEGAPLRSAPRAAVPSTPKPQSPKTAAALITSVTPVEFKRRFEEKELLGTGTFGKVHRALDWQRGCAEVAVKSFWTGSEDPQTLELEPKISKRTKPGESAPLTSRVQPNRVLNELAMLTLVNGHENVVSLVGGFWLGGEQFAIVMEYLGGGELFHAANSFVFTDLEAAHMIGHVLEGVSFLHSKSVCHRDLKLENIVLRGDPRSILSCSAVITDFGLAAFLPSGSSEGAGASASSQRNIFRNDSGGSSPTLYEALCEKWPAAAESPAGQIENTEFNSPTQRPRDLLHTPCGSPLYVAPELCDPIKLERDGYGLPVDIWAVGVMAYALLAGQFPFNGETTPAILKEVTHGFDPHFFTRPGVRPVSAKGQSFVALLLVKTPQRRAKAETALSHSWLKQSECAMASVYSEDEGGAASDAGPPGLPLFHPPPTRGLKIKLPIKQAAVMEVPEKEPASPVAVAETPRADAPAGGEPAPPARPSKRVAATVRRSASAPGSADAAAMSVPSQPCLRATSASSALPARVRRALWGCCCGEATSKAE